MHDFQIMRSESFLNFQIYFTGQTDSKERFQPMKAALLLKHSYCMRPMSSALSEAPAGPVACRAMGKPEGSSKSVP